MRGRVPEYYYPDIAFLVNFFFDYLLLFLVRYVGRLNAKRARMVLSTAMGSLFTVLVTAIKVRGIFLPIHFVLGGAILCAIAFGKKNIIRNILTLFICAFVMGGMLYVLSSFVTGMSADKKIIPTALILSILTIIVVLALCLLSAIRRKSAKTPIYSVRFCIGENTFCCKGLLDTGNGLYEPFGKKPVLLLISPEFKMPLEKFCHESPEKTRFIPYRAVGTQEGMLLGAELNQLVIETEQDEICLKNIPAAYSDSGGGNFYQVILHPDFFL